MMTLVGLLLLSAFVLIIVAAVLQLWVAVL
jgi:hypothetical protein